VLSRGRNKVGDALYGFGEYGDEGNSYGDGNDFQYESSSQGKRLTNRYGIVPRGSLSLLFRLHVSVSFPSSERNGKTCFSLDEDA